VSPAVLLAGLLLAAPGGSASPPPAEPWITDEDGVLEMLLAHRDDTRVDGGTLRLDRRKKLITWTGAPNEIGCKRSFEAAFSDVKSVEEERSLPGFHLELKQGKPKGWTLMPLPHVAYLLKGPGVSEGDLQQKASDAGLTGPDGAPLRVGGDAGGVGPRVKKRELPEEVDRDVRKAITALRDALASPGE
jgi:hypothetical protein